MKTSSLSPGLLTSMLLGKGQEDDHPLAKDLWWVIREAQSGRTNKQGLCSACFLDPVQGAAFDLQSS